MSARIILATGNSGKVREIQAVLGEYGINVQPQSDFGVPEADETGLSFVENAIIKARNACEHTGLPAIADDSGIEVDFLNGQPGIYSSRFAGEAGNDQANNEKLLHALAGQPESRRTARFQCVIVYMRHASDPTPIICQGTWEGQIARSLSGNNGFGYDPLFLVPSHHCTAAELDASTKNSISHRGQAISKLASYFQMQQDKETHNEKG